VKAGTHFSASDLRRSRLSPGLDGRHDIAFLPATRLLELYRAKDLSPVAVMTETLARLERYEGALNAFVLYDPDSAMAAARESEMRWRRGEPRGCSTACRSR
jgi:Asp-tRNA(Asn)/Glu-tRNA(Gln) amidotransferase A subunit family amidase